MSMIFGFSVKKPALKSTGIYLFLKTSKASVMYVEWERRRKKHL